MKITCFITICAYLSSTVSTDKIKYLNRIKRARSWEEFAVKDVAVEKEINSKTSEIYSDVSPALQKSRPRIETFQRSKRTHESQSELQQQQEQQHRHYNRGRSRRLVRRLKTRSITGTSTFELNDNELKDLIPTSKPKVSDDGSIRIEPVLRVHKKKNVFDSIVDIVRQLVNPSKDKLGPLVGPIQVPGSTRKIYLRLMEPIDSHQVIVRFVTQLPVPVIDVEAKQEVIPLPPIIDTTNVLLKQHPILVHDAIFGSSNRHHSVHPPRNAKQVPNKDPGSQSIKPSAFDPLKKPLKDPQGIGKESFSLGKNEAAKGAENDKNHFADAQLNLENHGPQFLGESGSYYEYQAEKEAVDQVNALFNDTTTIAHDGPKDSLEPWYQLSTHRLPLRQIAPLYPLTSMEHTDSNSYADTYKVPSDVLTAPGSYSSLYEQYNNANPTPGVYGNDQHYNAPDSYSVSYNKQNDVHTTPNIYSTSYQNEFDSVPNSYSISYNKQNDVHTTPNTYSTSYQKQNEFDSSNSYSVSYQNQNEFNNAPSSYSIPYQNKNEFNNDLSSYSTPYEKQNDLSSSSSSYSNSYEKAGILLSSSYVTSHQTQNNQIAPSSSHATSYKEQNGAQISSSPHDALRVIDPPSYFPGKPLENHVNRSFEHTAIRQPRYNLPRYNDANVMSSSIGKNSVSLLDEVIWGNAQREKSVSNFQKNAKILPEVDGNNREGWQPVILAHEDTDWHKALKADLAKAVRETRQQPLDHSKRTSRYSMTSSTDRKRIDQRQTGKRRGTVTTTRSPRCSSSKEDECERMKLTVTPTLHSEETTKVLEKQIQSVTNSTEIPIALPIVATTPKLATSNTTVETFRLDLTTKSSISISTMRSTTEKSPPLVTTTKKSVITERSPLLIKMITSALVSGTTEKLIVNEATVKPTITTEKTVASSTTKRSSIRGTTEVSVNGTAKRLQLPKRPIIMKKSIFIMKKMGSSSTAKPTMSSTQKPTVGSTTKKATTKRQSKPSAISKKSLSTT